MSLLPTMKFRAVTTAGVPIAGAKLYFYETGTATAKATYSDEDLTSANANPVVADGDGWFGLIYLLEDAAYRVKLTDAAGTQIWQLDNINGALPSSAALATRLKQVASNPLDYGAVGDGVADESAEVQDAIDAATGVVDLLGKTYKCDSHLDLASGITLRNGTLDFTACPDSTYINVSGSVGTANALTGNVADHATVLPLTSVAGLAAGDLLLLYDTSNWSGSTAPTGEIVRILSIAALNVTITSPIHDAYNTADGAAVKKITPIEFVGIEDLNIIGSTTAAGGGRNVYVSYGSNVVVRHVEIDGVTLGGISFINCVNSTAEDCTISNGAATAVGVYVLGASDGVRVRNSTVSGIYRGTYIGYDSASYTGVARNTVIDGCTFKTSSSAVGGVTAGGMTQSLSISHSYFGATNTSDGIDLAGAADDVRIFGCMFHGGAYGIDIGASVTNVVQFGNYFHGQTSGEIDGGAAAGLSVTGFGANPGLLATGGATSGDGAHGVGGAPNGIGLDGAGTGTGVGVRGTGGGTNAAGVSGVGGASNGSGGIFTGTGTGSGVAGYAGSSNGTGVYGSSDSATGRGVSANGSGGATALYAATNSAATAVDAASNSGYAARLTGHTANPPDLAVLRIVPQAADPTTGLVGDIYVTTAGVMKICTNAVGPTWTIVGTQS